jgi:diaminopimelate epimerase
VRAEVGDTDGILEVVAHGDDWIEIGIWNPDGSRAEMSGNGTRIAARWLAERTGAERVSVRVDGREVQATMLDGPLVEQELGPVAVGSPEEAAGVRFTAVDVGNPHAVVEGDPAELPRIGPLLETHERAGRPVGRRRDRGARVGARRGGDCVIGVERRRGGCGPGGGKCDGAVPGRAARGAYRGRSCLPDGAGSPRLVAS